MAAGFLGQAADLRPALDQAVVGQGFGGAFLALAEGVQAVAQLAGGLGLSAQLCRECGRSSLAPGFQHPNEVMDHLPGGEPGIARRVPVGGQLCRVSAAAPYRLWIQRCPRLGQTADAGVLGFGQGFGHAVLTCIKAVLLEPGQRPAAVGIKVALLFGQHLVEGLVDERQGCSRTETGLPAASSTLA